VPPVPGWHDAPVASAEAPRDELLWRRVEALIDRAPSDDDVRSHRLEVLAARRFRALGRPVPDDFAAQERFAAITSMTAPMVLERVRAAYDGPAIVLKGPEVAARYPAAELRGYGDIDLLVPDAEAAHQALLAAGFELVGDPALYLDIHHLRPLLASGMPLPVEVHSRPKWLDRASPPANEELFEAAVPGSLGLDGMLTLPREHHAVLLAVHSWAHEPLRRLRDLIDVAAMAEGADPQEIRRLARAWGVERLWLTTRAAAEALLGDRPMPWALRLWAQNLRTASERTVLQQHVERWLSDFWAMPFSPALRRMPATLAAEIRPEGEEGWRAKLTRSALAVRNATRRRSQHRRQIDERLSRVPSVDQSEDDRTPTG
jgi:hypothetical protein